MGADRRYYIWGCGRNIKVALEQLKSILNFAAIIDSDYAKQGTIYEGMTIISPVEFFDSVYRKDRDIIIISVTNPLFHDGIVEQLEKRELHKWVDYFEITDICKLPGERVPGSIKQTMQLPDGYAAMHMSFDPNSYMVCAEPHHIYRIIRPHYAEVTRRMMQTLAVNGFFDTYVVDSKIVAGLPGFESDLVIEHEYIHSFSNCYEWCPEMYEDYVFFMADFIEKLTNAGLALRDAHGMNATFWKGHFLFYDLGAIGEGLMTPRQLLDFLEFVWFPLIMMKVGQQRKAYFYLEDNNQLVMTIEDLRGWLNDNQWNSLREICECAVTVGDENALYNVMDALRRFIESLSNAHRSGDWADYQDNEWIKDGQPDSWSIKMKNAVRLMDSISPKSIVDIAGNQGWYGIRGGTAADRIVVIDCAETAITKLYERIKENHMPNVIPVYMSICAPSLGRHLDGYIDCNSINPMRKPAIWRYRSELAIALAIVHHLVFRMLLSFEEIMLLLSNYTSKYLLVEFVEIEDKFISDFLRDGYEWYTKENFELELNKRFEIIEQAESSPVETRTMYLCRKREL